jgi:hypothetical protein
VQATDMAKCGGTRSLQSGGKDVAKMTNVWNKSSCTWGDMVLKWPAI